LVGLAIAALRPVHAETTDASLPRLFLQVPQPSGWRHDRDDESHGLPQLSSFSLASEDDRTRVTVSLYVFASTLPTGRSGPCGLSGVLSAARWLPRGHLWTPLGDPEGRCFWTTTPTASKDPAYQVQGQARCRRANFIELFTFSSRAAPAEAARVWRNAFRAVVLGTRTAAPCLSPEQMTYLADREGPPFVSVKRDPITTDVAAQSMCGSGGCGYYRFRRARGCFHLVDCNVRDEGEARR
jgi:hypothetical protein